MEDKEWAVVTGGSRGIGRAIVRAFADIGYSIVAIGRDEQALSEVVHEVELSGHACEGVVADLADPAETQVLADALVDGTRNIVALVNNAGGGVGAASLAETDLDDWRRIIRLNVLAPYVLTRTIGADMASKGYGRIVNVSSAAARYKVALDVTSSAYVAAKAALLGLTRQAAVLLADSGVTVNAVLPGDVLTSPIDDDAVLDGMLKRVPRGQLTTSDEVAATVRWLCSREAGAVTGVSLDVNSGTWIGD